MQATGDRWRAWSSEDEAKTSSAPNCGAGMLPAVGVRCLGAAQRRVVTSILGFDLGQTPPLLSGTGIPIIFAPGNYESNPKGTLDRP